MRPHQLHTATSTLKWFVQEQKQFFQQKSPEMSKDLPIYSLEDLNFCDSFKTGLGGQTKFSHNQLFYLNFERNRSAVKKVFKFRAKKMAQLFWRKPKAVGFSGKQQVVVVVAAALWWNCWLISGGDNFLLFHEVVLGSGKTKKKSERKKYLSLFIRLK